jgi:hypothetical protein
MTIVERDERQGKGQNARNHQRPNKEHRDVRQFITGRLNDVQETIERTGRLLSRSGHGFPCNAVKTPATLISMLKNRLFLKGRKQRNNHTSGIP